MRTCRYSLVRSVCIFVGASVQQGVAQSATSSSRNSFQPETPSGGLASGVPLGKSLYKRISSHFLSVLAILGLLGCLAAIGYAQTDNSQPAQSWLEGPYMFGDW